MKAEKLGYTFSSIWKECPTLQLLERLTRRPGLNFIEFQIKKLSPLSQIKLYWWKGVILAPLIDPFLCSTEYSGDQQEQKNRLVR
jgi:hypothetical protein